MYTPVPPPQVDQEEDLPLQRSGNPGYLDGQPVLAGVETDLYPYNHNCTSWHTCELILVLQSVMYLVGNMLPLLISLTNTTTATERWTSVSTKMNGYSCLVAVVIVTPPPVSSLSTSERTCAPLACWSELGVWEWLHTMPWSCNENVEGCCGFQSKLPNAIHSEVCTLHCGHGQIKDVQQ